MKPCKHLARATCITGILTVFSISISGCALTGTSDNTGKTTAKTTHPGTATTTTPKRKNLRDIADDALASKGKLSPREINAILKTQSVCRPK